MRPIGKIGVQLDMVSIYPAVAVFLTVLSVGGLTLAWLRRRRVAGGSGTPPPWWDPVVVPARRAADAQGLTPVAGVLAVDRKGRIVSYDGPAGSLLGQTERGSHLADLLPALADQGPDPVRTDLGECVLVRPDGDRIDVEVMAVAARPEGWLIALRDAGPRRQHIQELERLALHDPLTGLPNRALFADRAGLALAMAERRQECCAVLMLDLDHFKQVNDTLGHDIGDLVLHAVAPRLSQPLRRTDTLARVGGDEFAVLLPPPTSPEEAIDVARRLVLAMAAPFLVDGFSLPIGISIGIALRPNHGQDLEVLLRAADEAMYAAKRDALGHLLAGEPAQLGVIRRPALRNDLEKAIADRSLTMYFQPKVDAMTRAVAGFEGLLRWNHPAYGWLQPPMFLPVAERAGLMGPLTEFVLDECLRQQHAWRQAGYHLELAVNLATFWLRDDRLVEQVGNALAQWAAPACDLTFDVTEGSIMSDPDRGHERLQQLRALGCRVAMDDFGTGYSSLTQLQRLPLDEIKVHSSFVAPLEQGLYSARVVLRSIVGIAQGLGLTATAEGVESERVARMAAELGCARLQGFLIAAPMNALDALCWLEQWPAGVAGAGPAIERAHGSVTSVMGQAQRARMRMPEDWEI